MTLMTSTGWIIHTIIAFDEQAQTVFNRLHAQKLRVGTLDLRIAAIP